MPKSELYDKRKDEAKEKVKALLGELSYYGSEEPMIQAFVEVLLDEHRTNQATTIRTLIHILCAYGDFCEENRRYDGRNEAAVKVCKMVSDLFGTMSGRDREFYEGYKPAPYHIIPIPFI